jgi:TRAP-type C4-dicarboxylate transport system permease small subunit
MGVLRSIRRVELFAAAFFLCAIVAVVFLGTLGRYLGHPVIWTDEVAQALFVWTAILSADITLQRSGHFRIDMLVKLLPEALQFWLELVTKLVIAALLCLLVWYGVQLARLTSPRPLPLTGVSSAFATGALAVGFGLMLITVIEQLVVQLRRGRITAGEARDVM